MNYLFNGSPVGPLSLTSDGSGEITIDGLVAGSYTGITVSLNSCVSAEATTFLNDPAIPDAPSLTVSEKATCQNPEAVIEITFPISDTLEYSIDNGPYQSSPVFSGVLPGSHGFTVRTMASPTCVSDTTTIAVSAPPGAPDAPAASSIQPTCQIPSGTIQITEPLGDTIAYSIDGIAYQQNPMFENLIPGVYPVTARNTNDTTCISVSTAIMINAIPSPPAMPLATVIQPTCSDPTGSIEVTHPLGDTLQYSIDGTLYQDGTIFAQLLSGTYPLTVRSTTDTTCISASFEVTIIPAPVTPEAPVSSGDVTECEAHPVQALTAQATVPAGVVLTWYSSATGDTVVAEPVLNAIGSVTYYAEASIDSCRSHTRTPVTLTINREIRPAITISADQLEICPGTAVTFSSIVSDEGSAPTYEWFIGSTPAGTNSSTLVTSALTDGDVVTCRLTSSETLCVTGNPVTSNPLTITVNELLTPAVTITADHPTTCPGETVTFTAIPENQGTTPWFEWFVNGSVEQEGASTLFAATIDAGNPVVVCRMTSSMPCTTENPVSSPPFVITVVPAPEVVLTQKEFLCAGAPVELDAGAGFSSYVWQDGSTGRFYTAMEVGTYSVQVIDANGCHAGASVLMKNCSLNLFVPNAFSPNGDGINDRFTVRPNIDEITAFSMVIFNRSGEAIFETHDIGSGWDGTFKGQPCPQDTYVWVVTWQAPDNIQQNSPTTMKGTFVLLR